jgi:hypothetical protein
MQRNPLREPRHGEHITGNAQQQGLLYITQLLALTSRAVRGGGHADSRSACS